MNIWMMNLILMLTGCQCSHRPPTKETDPDHQRWLPEVVQKEELRKAAAKHLCRDAAEDEGVIEVEEHSRTQELEELKQEDFRIKLDKEVRMHEMRSGNF